MPYSFCHLPSAFTTPGVPVETQRAQYLNELVSFISKFQWLSSVHAYDALHEGFFENVWPEDWRHLSEDEHFDSEALIDLVKDGLIQSHWPPSLREFIANCQKLKLPRTVNLSDFPSGVLDNLETNITDSSTTSSGMSRKKLHEVERFSRVILERIQTSEFAETARIVDIGAGQGYLTHRLSTEFPCVAVDFDQIQTVGSVSRGNNIKKGFVKDVRGKKDELVAPVVQERKPVIYKTILINAEKLQQLLKELEDEDPAGSNDFVLVGLHACGDLSGPAMLHTFEKLASVKMMAVVPCCFNLLTEPDSPCQVCETHGFPMSKSTRTLTAAHNLTLGYKSRNLSTQTLDSFDREGIQSNLTGHYKRSLLDALLWHFNLDPISKTSTESSFANTGTERKQHKFRLGKMPVEAYEGGFLPYAVAALERLGLANRLTPKQIQEFLDLPRYKNARNQIFLVHCIKSMLSRVVESIVLMDRFMAIVEMNERTVWSGIEVDVEMLNLFDVVESPRNMVYLAKKQINKL